jgi:hypothetical protein
MRSVLRRLETTKRGLSNVVTIVALEKRIKAKTGLFGVIFRVSLNRLEEQGRAAHVDKRQHEPLPGAVKCQHLQTQAK